MFDDRDERSDAQLLAAAGDGDRTALEMLYVRHAPWLLVRLSRRCADGGLVDEVVQDTFVSAWRDARRWSGRGEVSAWKLPPGEATLSFVAALGNAGYHALAVPGISIRAP